MKDKTETHKLRLVTTDLEDRERVSELIDEMAGHTIRKRRAQMKTRAISELCYHAAACRRLTESVNGDDLPQYVNRAIYQLVKATEKYLAEDL